METTKYTFWKLINEFSITVPIIQRDYAQGRITEKITEIRENFIESIYNAIQNENENLDFDFIYGSIKELDENTLFIPLDGQQRLTTLFLLHWYLSTKEQKENIVLQNFKYETRTSSSDFCNALVTQAISIPSFDSKVKLSFAIENSSWFYLSWKRDPTIQSILVMLDAINEKFHSSNDCFDKLISLEKPPITFQFIKLENFGLTDNLYIKMNARGKSLSDFENFKAKFEKFLDLNHKNLKDEFSNKIDGIWTDMLWKHKEENVIDNPFTRYFYFITEMLYFENKYKGERTSPFEYFENKPKLDYHLISEVYMTDEDNLKFLFSSLDKLTIIENIVQDIFSGNSYHLGKIALFKGNVNLLKQCLVFDDFGIYEKLLLFSLINYIVKNNSDSAEENLKDYIRVVRNLLLRVRWQDKIEFKSNLRYDFITNQIHDITNILLSDSNCYKVLESVNEKAFKGFQQRGSLSSEIQKAKIIVANSDIKTCIFELEDHGLLQGSIHNFDLINNSSKLVELKEAFYKIWSTKDDSLIVRSLLTIDDYSLNIGWSVLGDRRYFGNGKNWNTILTNYYADEDLSFLSTFLSSFNNNSQSLQNMIENWLNSNPEKDWRYYFIKYKEMTSTNNNLYSWGDDFKIRNLTKSRLSGWHINPYVRTVVHLINDKSIVDENYCYSKTDFESPLWLKDDTTLYCETEGWRIGISKQDKLSDDLKKEFTFENGFLKPDEKRDMIQVAIDFSKKKLGN